MATYSRYPGAARRRKPVRSPFVVNHTALLLAAIAGVALLIPLALLVGVFLYLQVFGLILPGIRAGDIALGGLSREQAARKIDQAWHQDRQLIISDGVQVWSASPADFGLMVDAQATAEQAYQYGRGPAASVHIRQLLAGYSPQIMPVIRFFPEIARLQLTRWASLVQTEPQEAALVFTGDQWQAVPGKNGASLDVARSLQHIHAHQLDIIAGGFLQLVTTPVVPQVADLSAELQHLQPVLTQPVTLHAYDPITNDTIEWTVAPEQFGGWLRVEQSDGQPVFSLDQEQFNHYLRSQQPRLGPGRSFQPAKDIRATTAAWQNRQPLTVEVRHDATEYIVQPGDTLIAIGLRAGIPYWKILSANPQLTPNSTLTAGQILTIPSRNEMLPLPIVPGKRIVISITQQRMWTYENGALRSEEIVSTGIDRSPTHPGVFQVQTHEQLAYASVWDLYMPHFLGIYEGWPGFMNGIHGLPTLSNGTRMWANSLGRKASYGCIILSLQAAEDLYHWAENGIIVEIQP